MNSLALLVLGIAAGVLWAAVVRIAIRKLEQDFREEAHETGVVRADRQNRHGFGGAAPA